MAAEEPLALGRIWEDSSVTQLKKLPAHAPLRCHASVEDALAFWRRRSRSCRRDVAEKALWGGPRHSGEDFFSSIPETVVSSSAREALLLCCSRAPIIEMPSPFLKAGLFFS